MSFLIKKKWGLLYDFYFLESTSTVNIHLLCWNVNTSRVFRAQVFKPSGRVSGIITQATWWINAQPAVAGGSLHTASMTRNWIVLFNKTNFPDHNRNVLISIIWIWVLLNFLYIWYIEKHFLNIFPRKMPFNLVTL